MPRVAAAAAASSAARHKPGHENDQSHPRHSYSSTHMVEHLHHLQPDPGHEADGVEVNDAHMQFAVEMLGTMEERTKEDIVKEDGVPQHIFLDHIKNELDNESACLELPLTLIMLIAFSVLALVTLQQPSVHAVEEAAEFDIVENANFAFAHAFGHKGIADVNAIADFWSWMRLGYLPLVVQKAWAYSELMPDALGELVFHANNYSRERLPQTWLLPGYDQAAPIDNDYLRYSRIIGGIRMQQEVAPASASLCTFPLSMDRKALENWLGKPCMPSSDGLHTPDMTDADPPSMGERTQWLFLELDSIEELRRVVLDMEDGCGHSRSKGDNVTCRCMWCMAQRPQQPWIDEQTRRVEVTFIMYNPQYGLYSYVSANFYFNRGGHIHKYVNVMCSWADPLNPTMTPITQLVTWYLCALTWCGCLLYVFVNEVKDIISLIRSTPQRWYKTLKEDYLGVWNSVDWVSICVGVVMVVLYFRVRFAVATVNEIFVDMMRLGGNRANHQTTTGDYDTAYAQQYKETAQRFFSAYEAQALKEIELRRCLSVYPNILMLRLFKSFEAQPRLAIVTTTLKRAVSDLAHFSLVFVCVFLCLMVQSILIFGQDVEDFSNFSRATITCFFALFGIWDWSQMEEVGYLKTMIWFWTFMLIMVLILLNMLLAIIMYHFTAEKDFLKTANPVTLITQVLEMRRRRVQFLQGERVRLGDIWDVFKEDFHGDEKAMLKCDRTLNIDFLVSRVPRMPRKQAERLLMKSLEYKAKNVERDKSEEADKEEIKKRLDSIHKRTEQVLDDMEAVAEKVQYYDRLQVPGDTEYDSVFGEDDECTFYGRPRAGEEQSLKGAVTELSNEIGHTFLNGMSRIEEWQDAFQKQQDEVHSMLTETQMLIKQHEWVVAALSEAVAEMHSPEVEPIEPTACCMATSLR